MTPVQVATVSDKALLLLFMENYCLESLGVQGRCIAEWST